MKKKLGIRTLAAILAASVVMSASTGMVSAKNSGASVSATGNVSDTSAASETTTRSAAKSVAPNVSVEGAALNGTKAPTGLSGDGTTADPYQIGSSADLLLMNSYINYERSGNKEFVLTKDVSLAGVTFSAFTEADGIWSLVSAKPSLSGNSNVYFHLNGNGHKLYGLNVSLSKNASAAAIFGCINANSSIDDLTVEGCVVRVNHEADGAFAVLAVQNNGAIRNVTVKDCVLDARLASVASLSSDGGWVSDITGCRVYDGLSLGVADNAGKVTNFTVSGSDTNKGIFLKGARRFVGVVAGQNRKDISGVSVSGVRVLSYGSSDGDASIAGKGEVAAYVGGVVGRNDKSATVASATVTLKYGSDILFGDAVGGIVGDNAGTVKDSIVTGTNENGATVTASTANLYGCGRYGAIAGVSGGSISDCGAYDVGFSFARSDAQNAYGGLVGACSGTITSCVATGSVNLQNASAAGAGGLVGYVQPGTTLVGNYAIVSVSQQGANVGALVGRDGTMTHIGNNNYWSSTGSGLATPVPNDGAGKNDLTAATPVIVLTKSTSGVTMNASALAFAWAGTKATAAADFTKGFTAGEGSVRVTKESSSILLVATQENAITDLNYTVSISVPAGIVARKLSARVSIPIFVTESAYSGTGSSAREPIIISNASQMRIMQYAPNAHYKLDKDITLGTDWQPIAFSGTLDGDGHMLRISKPLFTTVSGSRNGRVSDFGWKTDGANLNSGYIHDLQIVPSACVYGGVFGEVKNATLRDVTYTVSDEDDGFVALSGARSGALINELSGNVLLSGCTVSVPIAVTATASDGIGALVGYAAPSSLIAEDCATSSLMSLEENLANVGGLFGNIASANGTVELNDCSATGCVYITSSVSDVRARIMIGAAASGVTARGCTYAPAMFAVTDGSLALEAAPFTDGIDELKPESGEVVQNAEEARSMLALIDPEMIEDVPMGGALSPDHQEGGRDVYLLTSSTDVTEMQNMLNGGTGLNGIFELQTNIDMGGAELKMSTTLANAFTGIFRSAGTSQFELKNFTVTNTSETGQHTSATALFCYARGAQFERITLKDVTVKNKGVGTAVLVGCADMSTTAGTGSATQCSFTNVTIENCNVYSYFAVNGTGYGLANASLAGTLIGGAWSTSTGNIYTITDILVRDCTVENKNWDASWKTALGVTSAYSTGGGSWAIGGVVGGSRVSAGTLCIGPVYNSGTPIDVDAAGFTPSVKLENVTVTGYSGVGGVIGVAGTNSTVSGASGSVTWAGTGGLSVNSVMVCGKTSGETVDRSSIAAGRGNGVGGSCGGIVGIELVTAGSAAVYNSIVSETDILSNNDGITVTNSYSDTGGIAGHMSGTVDNCRVIGCSIDSYVAGGIVGRSSRKGATNATTLLTIRNSKVKDTTICHDVNSASVDGEAGGIVASARFASVTIDGCTVGSKVSVSSAHFQYVGGFIGHALATATGHLYSVLIQDSATFATVATTATASTAWAGPAVGGAVGRSLMGCRNGTTSPCELVIRRCVMGGQLNNTNGYAGGVIGVIPNNYTTQTTSQEVFNILQCAVSAKITATYSAKLLAVYLGLSTSISATQARRWTYTDNIANAIQDTVISSYPSDLRCFGYYPSASGAEPTLLLGDQASSLSDAGLISAGCIEDVNKPHGGTNYHHGAATAFEYDARDWVPGVDKCAMCDTVLTSSDNVFTCSVCYAPYHAACWNNRNDSECERASVHSSADNNEKYWHSATSDFTIAVSNTAATTTVVEFDNADGDLPNTDKKYQGWRSTDSLGDACNDKLEVKDNTTAASIKLTAKASILASNGFGVTANYSIISTVITDATTTPPTTAKSYFIDPDTSTPAQLSIIIPVTLTEVPTSSSSTSGDSPEDAYQITDQATLEALSTKDLSNPNKYYKIMNDITLTGNFIPIKGVNQGGAFKCHLLGNGMTISGLTINSADSGLFASTDGATISDLTISGANVTGTGSYAAVLAGTAVNTTFENITITNATIGGASTNAPVVYAGLLAAYVTDTSADLTVIQNGTVQNAYFCGGVFGHAHYTTTSTDSQILGTTISGLSVTSTSTATQGNADNTYDSRYDTAGGIAGEFAGVIDSHGSGNSKTTTTIQKLTVSGGTDVNVAITGSLAGGVVGRVDNAVAGVCTINEVSLGDGGSVSTVTVTSSRTLINAAAGGIVGKICTLEPTSTGSLVATSPAVTLTMTNCLVKKDVAVSAALFAGGLLGSSASSGAGNKNLIRNCTSFATVSANQAGSAVGAIAGRVYDIPRLEIDHCVAGGVLSVLSYGGGVVGKIGKVDPNEVDTTAPKIEDVSGATPKLIYDTVVSASVTVTGVSNTAKGVLLGYVTSYQMNAGKVAETYNVTGTPFVNNFYSSYQFDGSFQMTGNSLNNNNEYLYERYAVSFNDLMHGFGFSLSGEDYENTMTVTKEGLTITNFQTGENSIRLWSDPTTVPTTHHTSGNYKSFTCTTTVSFKDANDNTVSHTNANYGTVGFVLSEFDSSGLLTFTASTGVVMPVAGKNGSGTGVLRYENGIELNLNLIVSDIKGNGSSVNPYLIERISHLDAIRTRPNKHFILAADIDFSFPDPNATYYTAHGQLLLDAGYATGTAAQQERLAGEEITADEKAWASNWQTWAAALLRETKDTGNHYIYRFTGSLSGLYKTYDYATDTYTNVDDPTPHAIKNLTVSTSYQKTSPGTSNTTVVDFSGAGFFPVIEAGASVSDITFSGCSFTSTAPKSNVGILAAENRGTISNVQINSTTANSTASGNGHVGGVVGVSYSSTAITHCTVTNATVASTTVTVSHNNTEINVYGHCAGGIVGGGTKVSNCSVTNTHVTGTGWYAGGIAGGNLTYQGGNDVVIAGLTYSASEIPLGLGPALLSCEYLNCTVTGCHIDTANGEDPSSDGGIIGGAEPGTSGAFRSLTVRGCTVDESTYIDSGTYYQNNYAGGIVGQVINYYQAMIVENCTSKADVTVRGCADYMTVASALIGAVAENDNYQPYDGETVTFRMINNICGGYLHSPYIAGGVCGFFGAEAASGYEIPSNSAFACGNIICAKFQQILQPNGVRANNPQGFGVFMGYCSAACFGSNQGTSEDPDWSAAAAGAMSCMTRNYYSSYVTNVSKTAATPRFGATLNNPVTDCGGLYDVAKFSTMRSSLNVHNIEYSMEDEYTPHHLLQSQIWSDQVVIPEYEDENTGTNVFPSNTPMLLSIRLQFDTNSNTQSADFALKSTSLTVYPEDLDDYDSVNAADEHTLALGNIYVDPDDGENDYYTASRDTADAQKYRASLTVRAGKDPEECETAYDLVADLGYGLLVGIAISTPQGNGDADQPLSIPDAKTFAHYFYSYDSVMDEYQSYLTHFYRQTGPIDWNDVLKIVRGVDTEIEIYEGDTRGNYGYRDSNGNFVRGQVAPIGSAAHPFIGGYDGGYTTVGTAVRKTGAGNKITNFHYTAASGITEVGLFGCVSDASGGTTIIECRLQNIHIELSETALDTDDYIPNGDTTIAKVSGWTADDYAGVFGGNYTGGLVGLYQSNCTIENCSVIYGTVHTTENAVGANEVACVGGLVGKIEGTPTLRNCFTMTNVRAKDQLTKVSGLPSSYTSYACGGLVGFEESESSSGAMWCTFQNCFCASDVVGLYYVGGFVGRVGAVTHVYLDSSASTATVTNLYNILQANDSTVSTTLVVGRRASEGQGNDYYVTDSDEDPYYVAAHNVYVAGLNTSEYRFTLSSHSYNQGYSVLFGLRPLINDDAGHPTGGIYYDSSAIGRLSVPDGTVNPQVLKVTGKLFDSQARNQVGDGTAPFTANTTKALTGASHVLSSAFTTTDTALYPVTKMALRGGASESQLNPDPYFGRFAKLCALPMFTDSRELDDVAADRTYVGTTYPTTISKHLGSGQDAPAITIQASKYSYKKDLVDYPANYDYLLGGNLVSAGDTRGDMRTDLLFNRGSDVSSDERYRSDYLILRNTNLTNENVDANNSAKTFVYDRNERSPFVRVFCTVDSEPMHRTIHIGLRSSTFASYISTERQLRALTDYNTTEKYTDNGTNEGKFYFAYRYTIEDDKNIRLCADIEFKPYESYANPSQIVPFTPIPFDGAASGDGDEGTYGFDGSNCEIRNLYSAATSNPDLAGANTGGLFASIGSGVSNTLKIQNLILRNVISTGTNSAGALAASIVDSGAQIINCCVIGGKITVTNLNSKVGGLVGDFHGSAKWIGVTGVKVKTGSDIAGSSQSRATSAGLIFGTAESTGTEEEKTTISDVFAIGEVDAAAEAVGGVAGKAPGVKLSNAVTSGYINGKNAYQCSVGGVIGTVGQSSMDVQGVISTAYVTGGDTANGGIIGSILAASGGATRSIKRTIFAGATAAGGGVIVGSLANDSNLTYETVTEGTGASAVTRKTVYFDWSLQRNPSTSDMNTFVPLNTWQLVSGSNFPANEMIRHEETENGNTSLSVGFTLDPTGKYYPNPIDMRGQNAGAQVSNVLSDEFKVGLNFALARINMVYSGTIGSVAGYDQISVTSPISIDTTDSTKTKSNAADTVDLAEYLPDNSAAINTDNRYLDKVGTSLVPHRYEENAYTGVRATLNTSPTSDGKPTYNGVQVPIYRFLLVNACRTVDIDYTVEYDDTVAFGDSDNKLVLMLKTNSSVQNQPNTSTPMTFSSNAATSAHQDYVDASQAPNDTTYTVRFRRICVPADNQINVSALLPSQYKLSEITAVETYYKKVSDETYNKMVSECTVTNGSIVLDSNNTAMNTSIKINVKVSADPSWGLRDMNGGIG